MTRDENIARIRDFVPRLRATIAGLNAEQLSTPYHEGEWTIAQNVHHLVDTHVNTYLRFKMILTDEHPTLPVIWAEQMAQLPDAMQGDIADSLMMLHGMHRRWATMMMHIQEDAWQRQGYYPKLDRDFTLEEFLVHYAQHCDAHLQQIRAVMAHMP